MTGITRLPLKLPPQLADQVATLARPPNPEFAGFPALKPIHDPAAGEWLRRKRELITQAVREDCHDWLLMLSHGINGVAEGVLERREFAIWSMCCDLPGLVWCEETMRAMWKRTAFLPTPGECRDVLEAYAAPLLREIEVLERIANTPAPKPRTILPPYEPPPAPEWITARAAERTPLFNPHPPVRTVAEQIAALQAGPPDPPGGDL
jgi:hypothetical protein